jgi:hypothetical protein
VGLFIFGASGFGMGAQHFQQRHIKPGSATFEGTRRVIICFSKIALLGVLAVQWVEG